MMKKKHNRTNSTRAILSTAVILLFTVSSVLAIQTDTALLEDGNSVYFIGNSKVGSEGGLHHHFRRTVAKAEPTMSIETHWIGMYNIPTLKDMHTDEVVERIETGNDDLIIVQSGSNEAMNQFADLISKNDKIMVIFGAWADNPLHSEGGMAEFRESTRRHVEQLKQFEKDQNIPVVPSGLIYYDLIVDPISFEGLREDYLFVPGGSVQNDFETLVNVAAIYAVTTGRSPVGLPMWDPFPHDLVNAVQSRVWNIIQKWNADEIPLKPVPQEEMTDSGTEKVEMSRESPEWTPLLEDGDQIFYVGNSFIGSEGGLENHFPRLLTEIEPSMDIFTSSRIFWGQGLRSMYTDEVREEIGTGRNDIVVVTSGPIDLLQKFHDYIEQAGNHMVIHMTWGLNPAINEGGLESYREQTERNVENMQAFEEETGTPVVPCGLIFYDLIVDPPDIDGLRLDWVYMVEDIHQNHLGTMVNASAHYAVMTGRSPVGLPMWDPYPPELVEAVQERAWQIVRDWKAGNVNVKNYNTQ